MSKNSVLDTALSIIDKCIHDEHNVNYEEIGRNIYVETGYCTQDYNKFLSVISSGSLTLRDYIRKRRLYFAVYDLMNYPEKSLADIAQDYGYSEQSAFTRAVKRECSKTPAELRKSRQEIPDSRENLESCLSNNSRLDSIFEKLESNNLSTADLHYFEAFIHATDELGFDISTCCLISELSEKLSIPFGCLLERCFEMAIEYNQDDRYQTYEIFEFMMEMQIEDEDELEELCQHYNCKWYELTFTQVKLYQLGIDSDKKKKKICNYYNCQWSLGEPYPLTRQMVLDYHKRYE